MAASGATLGETAAAGALRPEAGKWIVAVSVLLGSFLSVMDATVVNVAMPHMMGTFGTDLLTVTWVATAYSIAALIMVTMAAWWSTLLGRKRFYLISMGVFIIGSVMAGMSRTLTQMIVCRILQGFGGGALGPCSQAIVREKFPPEEQAMAMALYTMGVVLAPAIGPVVGGLIIDRYGWPWVFYINVPICMAGLLMVSSFVRDPSYLKRGFEKIDWGGIALLTVGLASLQIVLERGEKLDWFNSNAIIAGAIVAGASLIGLVFWEMSLSEPVVNFRLFRNFPLAIGSIYVAIMGFALFGSTFVLPQFTQGLLGYSAMSAGLVMIPRSIVMFVMMPVTGRLYNYADPRIQVTLALFAQCYAYWRLGHFTLGVGFWTFAPSTMLMGLGLANSNVVMSTMSLSTIPRPLMTQASSLYTLARQVAGNVAYATMATQVARSTQIHRTDMVENISPLSPPYLAMHEGLAAGLRHRGASGAAASSGADAMINVMINRQSTMMAYNDVYTTLYKMFIFAIPLVWLVPGTAFPKVRRQAKEVEVEAE